MKVTHEKLLEYMLKTDFQPILVNFWCGNLGGPKAYILKSGGAVAPLAPMVPPPMHTYIQANRNFSTQLPSVGLAQARPN